MGTRDYANMVRKKRGAGTVQAKKSEIADLDIWRPTAISSAAKGRYKRPTRFLSYFLEISMNWTLMIHGKYVYTYS